MAMKNVFKSLIFAAIAATTFAACSESSEVLDENGRAKLVGLTISTDKPEIVDDTRTMVSEDGITPLWCPGDAIGVSVYAYGEYVSYKFTNDNTTAPSVKTTFSGYTAVGDMLYTYYPYGNISVDPVSCEAAVTIPDIQHPTPASFDGAADILVGKPVEMTPATTKIEGLQFRRMGGFLKIVLKDQTSGNLLADESVNTLSISADKQLVGQNGLDIMNCRLDDAAGNYGMTVTADYTAYTQYRIGDDKAAAWLGVYPQTLVKSSTLVISAKTRGYEIHREVTLPRDIEIKAGAVVRISVIINDDDITEREGVIPEDMEIAFPDPVFRAYVLRNFDTDKDGKLSEKEASSVYYIWVPEMGIKSLEGIQYFTSLYELNCASNELTTLDLSKCRRLERLDCSSNRLTTLDLTKTSMGKTISDEPLRCGSMPTLETLYLEIGSIVYGVTVYRNEYCIPEHTKIIYVDENGEIPNGEGYDIASIFPDPNFRQWVLNNADLDHNGNLSDWEAELITEISCSYNRDYSSLKGIEYFPNLTELQCFGCGIIDLDVSKNTALKKLNCSSNKLTNLNVSGCQALEVLNCYGNSLTTLDVSQNTALTSLSCDSNQLTTLDVSDCPALGYLSCNNNKLTTLDLSHNTALGYLNCNSNSLTALNLSGCSALEELNCESNSLTTLNLNGCPKLTRLECYSNNLITLDFSQNTALRYLNCSSNKLTTLDVTNTNLGDGYSDYPLRCGSMPTLETLYIKFNWRFRGITFERNEYCIPSNTKIVCVDDDGNILNSDITYDIDSIFPDPNFRMWIKNNMDFDQDGKLFDWQINMVTQISCPYEGILSLEGIECFTNLTELDCHSNHLTDLDVSKNAALKTLDCNSNKLTNLNVSGCQALEVLNCYWNSLTTLDVSKNLNLTRLDCTGNSLTILDLSDCPTLGYLNCNSNNLTTLNLSGCSALQGLSCSSNRLTTLNLNGCPKLTQLDCYSNSLTTLNVNSCPELTQLDCYSNNLTTLDVSQNTALNYLNCSSNKLTTLDVTKTNLGNGYGEDPLRCGSMPTLKTLYIKRGWLLYGITIQRNEFYIHEQTQIIYVD